MATTNKTTKIIYWISTGILAAFILPGIFFINSKLARDGMAHMQIPDWLGYEVGIGSFIGGLMLVIPLPMRLKEWAYVALGIVYISAFIGHLTLDGIARDTIHALIMFGILLVSYSCYHKIKNAQTR